MRSEALMITPELAKEWLKKNNKNFRAISQNRVALYAKAMERGEWYANGESICFLEDGSLSDGQHRLLAVVKSGVPIFSLVAWGCHKDGVDRGQGRTIGQVAKSRGIKNALALTAMAALMLQYRQGQWDRHRSTITFTDAERFEVIENWHDEMQSALHLARLQKAIKSVSLAASVIVLGWPKLPILKSAAAWREHDDELPVWLMLRLEDGLGLGDSDPVYHFRRIIEKQRRQQRTLNPLVLRCYLSRCWNLTMQDRMITQSGFNMRFTGPKASKIPTSLEQYHGQGGE